MGERHLRLGDPGRAAVVLVFDDGREVNSTNQCEVEPAGNAKGWGETCTTN